MSCPPCQDPTAFKPGLENQTLCSDKWGTEHLCLRAWGPLLGAQEGPNSPPSHALKERAEGGGRHLPKLTLLLWVNETIPFFVRAGVVGKD